MCYKQHNREITKQEIRLRNILGIMLIIISLTSKAGAEMENLKITRLGKVTAGEKTEGSFKTETNYPEPIVLWDSERAAAVLYFKTKTNMVTGTLKQSINYLEPPESVKKRWLKSLIDDYPIKFRAHGIMSKKDERTMNSIESTLTADINGDGTDELIITKHLGEVEVYNVSDRIDSFKSSVKPKFFDYSTDGHFHISLDSHDEIFFILKRDLYGNIDDLSELDRAYCNSTPNEKIIRVGIDGIREIVPLFPEKFELKQITAVFALNKPGSKILDELIIISEAKGQYDSYLSRHKMDGTSLDMPRKIYVEPFSTYKYTFVFAPQSNQVIALSTSDKRLYFITPDKPVNWIKTVDLEKLPKSNDYIEYIGIINKDSTPVIFIRQGENIYAIDANGKYHRDKNGTIGNENNPIPITTIKPDSKYHEIHKVFPVGKNMDEFLAIQTRTPQKKELSEEELEWAGERFLSDRDWELCRSRLKLDYDDDEHEYIGWFCRDNKIATPVINSLEDIKTKLPGYYDKMVKDSKTRFFISLNTRLFWPIEGEGYSIKDDDYKRMDEYKAWLKNAFLSPELVLSTHSITEGNTGLGRINGYFYELSQSGLDLSPYNAKVTGKRGQVIMTLKKKILDQNFEPAYYSITW